jgi:uncharacterized protein YjbI with pentapeptide repeats
LTVAVCWTESLFAHVITSPTLAVTVAGSNAKFAILTDTVPVASDGAHGPAAADAGASLAGASLAGASLAGAWLAGAWLAGAAVGALVAVPPPQAATSNIVTTRAGRVRVRDMTASSTLCARSSLGYVDVYAPVERPVS